MTRNSIQTLKRYKYLERKNKRNRNRNINRSIHHKNRKTIKKLNRIRRTKKYKGGIFRRGNRLDQCSYQNLSQYKTFTLKLGNYLTETIPKIITKNMTFTNVSKLTQGGEGIIFTGTIDVSSGNQEVIFKMFIDMRADGTEPSLLKQEHWPLSQSEGNSIEITENECIKKIHSFQIKLGAHLKTKLYYYDWDTYPFSCITPEPLHVICGVMKMDDKIATTIDDCSLEGYFKYDNTSPEKQLKESVSNGYTSYKEFEKVVINDIKKYRKILTDQCGEIWYKHTTLANFITDRQQHIDDFTNRPEPPLGDPTDAGSAEYLSRYHINIARTNADILKTVLTILDPPIVNLLQNFYNPPPGLMPGPLLKYLNNIINECMLLLLTTHNPACTVSIVPAHNMKDLYKYLYNQQLRMFLENMVKRAVVRGQNTGQMIDDIINDPDMENLDYIEEQLLPKLGDMPTLIGSFIQDVIHIKYFSDAYSDVVTSGDICSQRVHYPPCIGTVMEKVDAIDAGRFKITILSKWNPATNTYEEGKYTRLHELLVLANMVMACDIIHKSGISHLDLSDGNIMINDNTLKATVIDFGLSIGCSVKDRHILNDKLLVDREHGHFMSAYLYSFLAASLDEKPLNLNYLTHDERVKNDIFGLGVLLMVIMSDKYDSFIAQLYFSTSGTSAAQQIAPQQFVASTPVEVMKSARSSEVEKDGEIVGPSLTDSNKLKVAFGDGTEEEIFKERIKVKQVDQKGNVVAPWWIGERIFNFVETVEDDKPINHYRDCYFKLEDKEKELMNYLEANDPDIYSMIELMTGYKKRPTTQPELMPVSILRPKTGVGGERVPSAGDIIEHVDNGTVIKVKIPRGVEPGDHFDYYYPDINDTQMSNSKIDNLDVIINGLQLLIMDEMRSHIDDTKLEKLDISVSATGDPTYTLFKYFADDDDEKRSAGGDWFSSTGQVSSLPSLANFLRYAQNVNDIM